MSKTAIRAAITRRAVRRREAARRRPASFASGVDGEIQTLESSRAQLQQVSRFGEDDLVDREALCNAQDREADAASDDLVHWPSRRAHPFSLS
jgi:hypothetical protein